jgi:hypothetical protein
LNSPSGHCNNPLPFVSSHQPSAISLSNCNFITQLSQTTIKMSTPTPEELITERAQTFPPEVARRPSGFLSLAPATSASYPRAPKPRQPSETESTSSLTAAALVAEAAKQSNDQLDSIKRRTSSLSSDGAKNPNGFRFLKLGPVHWGEHPGDHKADWHEVAVE